jgi:hypothetical protein
MLALKFKRLSSSRASIYKTKTSTTEFLEFHDPLKASRIEVGLEGQILGKNDAHGELS